MATIFPTTEIQRTECIGNSLITINNNFDNLDQSVTNINNEVGELIGNLNNVSTLVTNISSQQLALAWVAFDPYRSQQFGPNAPNLENNARYLIAEYNVTSVIKVGTGVFTVTVPFDFPRTNQIPHLSISGLARPADTNMAIVNLGEATTSNTFIVTVKNQNNSFVNPLYVNLTIFGTQLT